VVSIGGPLINSHVCPCTKSVSSVPHHLLYCAFCCLLLSAFPSVADEPKIEHSSMYCTDSYAHPSSNRRVDTLQYRLDSHVTYSEKPHMEVVPRSSF
jgi:hypothetical protein